MEDDAQYLSQFWGLGKKAKEAGKAREDCPYTVEDPAERGAWLDGFDAA